MYEWVGDCVFDVCFECASVVGVLGLEGVVVFFVVFGFVEWLVVW